MFEANEPFVHWFANRWMNKRGVGNASFADDLRQAAYIGMIRACQEFDPKLGFRFTTFASRVLHNAMRHEWNEVAYGTIRVPANPVTNRRPKRDPDSESVLAGLMSVAGDRYDQHLDFRFFSVYAECLPGRNGRILRQFLNGHTYAECGAAHGVSRQRAYQIITDIVTRYIHQPQERQHARAG